MIHQAVQLHTAGKLADAESLYRKVLNRSPDEPAALHLFGVLRHQQGRNAEALDLLQRAVKLKPRDADAHVNLASIYRAIGDANSAIQAGKRAVELQPNAPEAWNNLALALKMQSRHNDAIAAFQRAIQLRPNHVDALMNLGNTLNDVGRHSEAITTYHNALRIRPTARVYFNLGLALRSAKRLDDSTNAFQQAVNLEPANAEFLATLGDAFVESFEYDKAIDVYRRTLALDPNLKRVFGNLALALRETNRIAEALPLHRRAVEFQPDSADAHFNLALTLLWNGEYEEGWREHEWRWKSTDFTSAPRDFARPMWDISIDPRGKTILVHAEQGFGDTLQFVRYAPILASLGARVIVESQPQLVRLLKSLDGVDQVIARGDPLPHFDLRIPMMSLPYAFKTKLASIPAHVPYLHTSGEMTKPAGLKIGLAWAGNPHRQLDSLRSMTLSMLAPLAGVPNVTFYSLQKLAGAEQAANPPTGMRLIDPTREFTDFADTAKLVAELDLVITVDTAAAHLAGAMGKPVWIMLPCAAGWRWMSDRSDSPWYPTARLFRQPQPGNWNPVIQNIALALAKW